MNSIIGNCMRNCMKRQMYQSMKQSYIYMDVMKRNFMKNSKVSDKEYFENVLKGFYKNKNIQIKECKGDNKSSVQPSFMYEVKKFSLVGSKENKKFELGVVVKGLHSKEHQELYKSDIAAKNEKIAYNFIFPYLNVYKDSTLPVPVCFYANDKQTILEDLGASNYKSFDKTKGHITLKECIYTLKALARFHAATIVLAHKNGDGLNKIKSLPKPTLYSDTDSTLLKHQQASLENVLSIYKNRKPTKENEAKIKALEHLIKVAKNDIRDLLRTEDKNYVFCHGDLMLTNFLFKLNEEKKKPNQYVEEMDIKFIDFQKIHYCSVASDLVYLLFINLQPDDYIKYRDIILNRYLYYLVKNVEDCGVRADFNSLTYEWLMKEIDRFTEYGIIYALWVLPIFEDTNANREVTKEVLDASLKNTVFNKRMEKWVDYYTQIFNERSQK